MFYTKSGNEVSPIGIGTWTIKKDNLKDEVETLKYYFNNGVNYIDVVLAYDNGETLDVIAEFVKSVKREHIFINALITFGCNTIDDMEKQIDYYLEKLGTNYLDCVTLHGLDVIKFSLEEYTKKIQELKETGKFLNIGYSNLTPEQLDKLIGKIDYFEGLYNLECKVNEDTGLIDKCIKNNIAFYAYQPLRRNRTAKQNYKEVVSLAEKYNKTQNQILINWMVKHKGICVLIKASNKEHIKENLESLSFEITKQDYEILDKFRNKEFDKLEISYSTEAGKIRIDQMPNQPIGIL